MPFNWPSENFAITTKPYSISKKFRKKKNEIIASADFFQKEIYFQKGLMLSYSVNKFESAGCKIVMLGHK